jgi:hypothetical protein
MLGGEAGQQGVALGRDLLPLGMHRVDFLLARNGQGEAAGALRVAVELVQHADHLLHQQLLALQLDQRAVQLIDQFLDVLLARLQSVQLLGGAEFDQRLLGLLQRLALVLHLGLQPGHGAIRSFPILLEGNKFRRLGKGIGHARSHFGIVVIYGNP